MSHLTLSGRKCKVGEKRAECIFHQRRSSRGSLRTRSQQRTSSGGKRASADPIPWYIAMSGPQKRKIAAALRMEEEKRIEYGGRPKVRNAPRYTPRWDNTRTGVRATTRRSTSGKKISGKQWWKRLLAQMPGPTGRKSSEWRAQVDDLFTLMGLR